MISFVFSKIEKNSFSYSIPEHCHKAQTTGQQEVLGFLALQSTLFLTSEQQKVSYIPA